MNKSKCWISSAHRGFVEGTLKENSLAAYYNAYLHGADMIETDARFIDRGVSFAETVKDFAERGKRCFCYTSDASDGNVKAIRDRGCLLALISLHEGNFEAAIRQHPDMCEFLHTSDFKAIEEAYLSKVKLYC